MRISRSYWQLIKDTSPSQTISWRKLVIWALSHYHERWKTQDGRWKTPGVTAVYASATASADCPNIVRTTSSRKRASTQPNRPISCFAVKGHPAAFISFSSGPLRHSPKSSIKKRVIIAMFTWLWVAYILLLFNLIGQIATKTSSVFLLMKDLFYYPHFLCDCTRYTLWSSRDIKAERVFANVQGSSGERR